MPPEETPKAQWRARKTGTPRANKRQDHASPRHAIRVDLIEEVYLGLLPLSEELGWSMNKLLREIAYQWWTEHEAGTARGVIPSIVRERDERERGEA